MNHILIQERKGYYNVESSWKDDCGLWKSDVTQFNTYKEVARFVRRFFKTGQVK